MVACKVELSIARGRSLEFHRMKKLSRENLPLLIRHDIAKHCWLNNKAADAKWSVIDHQKNQTDGDRCRIGERGDGHGQSVFEKYHCQCYQDQHSEDDYYDPLNRCN